jgi:hypothetical protein
LGATPLIPKEPIFLTIASIICLWVFFRLANKLHMNFLLAISLPITFYAIHPLSFSSLMLWSHNSFNFPFGSLILLWLLYKIQKTNDLGPSFMILIGIAVGILSTVQLYFFTWVLGVGGAIFIFLLLKRHSPVKIILSCFIFLISTFIGVALAILPIVPRVQLLFSWIQKLIFHQGQYGSGAEGITSISRLWDNMVYLVHEAPILFVLTVIILILISYLIYKNRSKLSEDPGIWAVILALTIQLLATYLLIFKHPALIYLLAPAAILPVLSLAVFKLFGSSKLFERIFCLGIAICFIYNFTQSILTYQKQTAEISMAGKEYEQIIQEYAKNTKKEPKDINVLWTYGSYSACYSLWFGNETASSLFSSEVSKICPNQYEYNIWYNKIDTSEGWIDPGMFDWDILITREDMIGLDPSLKNLGKTTAFLESDMQYGNLVIILKSGHFSFSDQGITGVEHE